MSLQQQRMLSGALYDAADAQLVAGRQRARVLCQRLNLADPGAPDHPQQCARWLAALFGREVDAVITPPFHCDYGSNIRLGRGVFLNFNCVVLDVAAVTIGDRTLIGPAVQIYTASHPMTVERRRSGLEYGLPVTIGADVWIGGGAVICPGVSIGDGAVVGAGSVVTRDIPPGVFAAGNPCRVLRPIDPAEDAKLERLT